MKYSFREFDKSVMARAQGLSLPISRKQSIEICSFIRGKGIAYAKSVLQGAIDEKKAIPFRKYNMNTPHKRKIGPGKYPVKSSMEILKLIESAEANAQFKGLNTSRLHIRHISANHAPKALHFGRKSRRRMKRTNIEIVVEEKAVEEKIKKIQK